MSTRSFGTDHSTGPRTRGVLGVLFALFLTAPLVPSATSAQAYGPAGGGGYGMMGGGGMMWGGGSGAQQQLTLSESLRFIKQSTASARVEKARNQVVFTGSRVFIAMAAVQPGFPDTTFEVAGLVDPAIVVPAGASITLLFINMDYGPNMDHGVVITDAPPPYPVMSMMGISRAVTGIPVLAPRTGSDAAAAGYSADSVTFTAPDSPGSFYYLCQYYDHAAKGMFGRFDVK